MNAPLLITVALKLDFIAILHCCNMEESSSAIATQLAVTNITAGTYLND